MITVEAHTKWLQQYTEEIAIMWDDHSGWTAEASLYSNGSLKTFMSTNFNDVAEATRELCDQVCEFLGDKCNNDL